LRRFESVFCCGGTIYHFSRERAAGASSAIDGAIVAIRARQWQNLTSGTTNQSMNSKRMFLQKIA